MPEGLEGKKYLSNNDIYNILKDEILNLQIKPGQPLSENTVAKRFGISRTPVRSVFEQLIKDNLLEVNPRRGTFVTLLDPDAINQIIYMRTKVETGVMTALARHPDQQLSEKLRDNLIQQEQHLASGMTPRAFYALDSRFHELCMEALGRQRLWRIIEEISVHYTRFRMLDYVTTKRFDALYKEHCALFDCMVSGNAESIEKQVTEHFCGGIIGIGNRLATEFSDYFDESNKSISSLLDDAYSMIDSVNKNYNAKETDK